MVPDFNVYYQPEIQKILLRQQSPRDGLGRMAKRCQDFKREWTTLVRRQLQNGLLSQRVNLRMTRYEQEREKWAGITRRHFLKHQRCSTGLMAGCWRNAPEGVVFKGWPYEPDLVRRNIEYFEQQSNIDVAYEAVSGNYHDKMVALFVGKTPMDCCYVRDDDFC